MGRSTASRPRRRPGHTPPRLDDAADGPLLSFPPFRFDPVSETLWSGKRRRSLRPRAAALLLYLMEHAGDVVTQEELLAALWPGVKVEPGVLRVYVWEIRQALRDRQAAPRFVETVPRRGYRWIAPFARLRRGEGDDRRSPSRRPEPSLVGRERELAGLEHRLDEALTGSRQAVFITGEPGIGKTALVDAFLLRAAARPGLCIAEGRCIEHYGPEEPYLPVLSALGELARGRSRRALVASLRRYAPTWLAQLPSLPAGAARPAVEAATPAKSQERVVRELVEALESLTTRRALILVLEDLHWSDRSTLDFVSVLLRRTGRARLLLIATHRPGEPSRDERAAAPPIDDLHSCPPSTELSLSFLGEADVADYLRTRCPPAVESGSLDDVARTIHRRTEGNPLFMVNLVDDLFAAEPGGEPWTVLREAASRAQHVVPPNLRQTIERRIERLDLADQLLLEAASAAGVRFSAATVSAVLGSPVADAEQRCARLARAGRFLEALGSEDWEDGTVAARFGFVHSLYERVLHDRLTAARRCELHRGIAERLERAYGPRAVEIAAELANHFEQGREDERALRHREVAAERALAKHANAEAAGHFARALELLERSPPSAQRAERELSLQLRLGAPLVMVRGYTAPEVEAVYARALELSREVGEGPQLLLALVGLYRFSLVRSEFRTAKDFGAKALRLAKRSSSSIASLAAHLMLGVSCFGLGEFVQARRHLEKSLSLYDPAQHRLVALSFGDDPGAACQAEMANALWFLGYPDQALRHAEEAVRSAREGGIPYSIAFALNYLVWARLLRREGALGREHADALVTIALDNDFQYWVAQGTAIRGWVLIEEGAIEAGIAELRAGLAAYRALGAEVVRPWHLGRLAEVYAQRDEQDEARAALDEAFVSMDQRHERYYEAELLRLRGELALALAGLPAEEPVPRRVEASAADDFERAIAVARRQRAKSLELRATLSLARLGRRQGKPAVARRRLGRIYAWFGEGRETGDLRDARALLAPDGSASRSRARR